jgi:hypothetical protein
MLERMGERETCNINAPSVLFHNRLVIMKLDFFINETLCEI